MNDSSTTPFAFPSPPAAHSYAGGRRRDTIRALTASTVLRVLLPRDKRPPLRRSSTDQGGLPLGLGSGGHGKGRNYVTLTRDRATWKENAPAVVTVLSPPHVEPCPPHATAETQEWWAAAPMGGTISRPCHRSHGGGCRASARPWRAAAVCVALVGRGSARAFRSSCRGRPRPRRPPRA